MTNFHFFLNINIQIGMMNFIISSSDKSSPLFIKNIDLEYINNNNLFSRNFDSYLKELIIDIERKFKNITMHKVNLMVEDTSANSIDIALKENFEYKNINKSKIEYLLKDIRYKLIKNHPDKYIAHIIVKKCFLDGVEYNFVPFEKKCKSFILDLSFIYLQKTFVSQIEKIFKNHQLKVNKIICTNYAKSLLNIDVDDLSKAGLAVLEDNNLNEVSVIGKKKAKMGFFEKVFHLLS